MTFIFANILIGIVYVQMNSTLAVYLRDFHGIAEQQFGYIMSLNAAMVVVMQFGITRRIRSKPPMWMMALGCVFYAVGFGMYGFVSVYGLFLLAMAIITIGEMIVSPVARRLSPCWHRKTCAAATWRLTASLSASASLSAPCWQAWPSTPATLTWYGTARLYSAWSAPLRSWPCAGQPLTAGE